jgi:hypothetical protein
MTLKTLLPISGKLVIFIQHTVRLHRRLSAAPLQ